MIKAIHIEDEPGNIALLQNLITTHCSDKVKLIGNATSLPEAYTLIKAMKPQLVYLDIELNQGNAFELLDQLLDSGNMQFEIIFVTAFNEYAVRAFRQNAVDYILKPISVRELKQATDKAIEKITNIFGNQSIAALLNQFRQNSSIHKIGLPVSEGLHFVNGDTIIKVEAKGSYAVVYLVGNKKIVCTKSLKDIEQLLPTPQFIRVHNAWLINSGHLKKYFRGKDSYLEMEDGSTVPVSIRKKGGFLDMV